MQALLIGGGASFGAATLGLSQEKLSHCHCCGGVRSFVETFHNTLREKRWLWVIVSNFLLELVNLKLSQKLKCEIYQWASIMGIQFTLVM